MAERRSIGDAMNMTPAKLAFIKGEGAGGDQSKAKQLAAKAGNETVVEVTLPFESDKSSAVASTETKQRSTRRPSRKITGSAPEPNEVLDQVLVPVTIRLPHRTAQALRRAYLEQRLKHAKPDTQQEIVEEALTDWLAQQGFLD